MKQIDKIFQEIVRTDACDDGAEWVNDQDTESLEKLWAICDRGDWMLWILYEMFHVEPVDCPEFISALGAGTIIQDGEKNWYWFQLEDLNRRSPFADAVREFFPYTKLQELFSVWYGRRFAPRSVKLNENLTNFIKVHACDEGKKWFAEMPSFDDAWISCERFDWMLWLLAAKFSVGPKDFPERFVDDMGSFLRSKRIDETPTINAYEWRWTALKAASGVLCYHTHTVRNHFPYWKILKMFETQKEVDYEGFPKE